MSKRTLKIRRTLIALSMGGISFQFLLTGSLFNCDRNLQNSDLVTFTQGIGNSVIKGQIDDVFDDAKTAGTIGTDADKWLRDPLTKISQAFWSNWAYLQFPQDPSKVAVVKP